MALEQARMLMVPKPWGATDLLPWSEVAPTGTPIGEIWFQRRDPQAPTPVLLLKLLFTQEMLSIQVHPDNAMAQAMGLPHGKTEAWYVLSATPEATVGVGLKSALTAAQLRSAIADGSIAECVEWRKVSEGDVIFVPAGMIHAIGPGLVLAEIQQRSDTTFRLFDHGRDRELHVEHAVAAANAGPADDQAPPQRLSDVRTLLVSSPYFVLERFILAAGSVWQLDAEQETWLVVIAGSARLGPSQAGIGEGCFIEAQTMRIEAGQHGLTCLVAYAAATPSHDLLRVLADCDAVAAALSPLPVPAVSPLSFKEARP
ncbi:mannose-6-phosphate isomerase [Bosea sp. Root381]|uniref:class I mannose-6-phosphate isomerase n=1 Tax=Bosea sp. Root381 TaxID=1736524 RepID=UPI0006FE64FC|nr:class I mannose-6-phosphate isomerase [Bosea sp. Root381]KRE09998.1 mannose-6-phosphate isomerase [Bosea sp. Root381]